MYNPRIHYHTDRYGGRVSIMFEEIEELSEF